MIWRKICEKLITIDIESVQSFQLSMHKQCFSYKMLWVFRRLKLKPDTQTIIFLILFHICKRLKQKRMYRTVWKFQHFSLTQILREINLLVMKMPFITIFETLKFDFWSFSTFSKSKNSWKLKSKYSKCVKMAIVKATDLPTLISRKI